VEQEDCPIGLVNTSGKDLLEDLDVDGRIILKLFVEKWIGFIWLRLGTGVQTAVGCLGSHERQPAFC
jgi:hypothetical protein